MKIVKKILVTAITALLFIAYGCQQESVFDTTTDLPYLSLPENTDFNNLSEDEMLILMNAFDRIGMYESEDGLYVMKARKGWEIGISENIFNYLSAMINDMNNRVLSNLTISRSGTLSNGETAGEYQNDCLARAIAAALGKPGSGDINAWITERYGSDGLYLEDAEQVLIHFGATRRYGFSDFNTGRTFQNNCCVMIYIENDNAHAVNAQFVGNNAVMYLDFQADPSGGARGGVYKDNIWGMYILGGY